MEEKRHIKAWTTGSLFMLGIGLLAFVEGQRPKESVVLPIHHPILVTVEKTKTKECSLEEKTHQEELARRWKYIEPGPMRDMCFSFYGPLSSVDALSPIKKDKAIKANVCVTFLISGEEKKPNDMQLEVRNEFEWWLNPK